MRKLTEEVAINEWVKFYKTFESVGLDKFYDVDKLREELTNAPCGLNEDSGVAYKGALLMHINMFIAIAQRMAKMISGTFDIDIPTLLKCCCIIHLSKRFMFVENDNEWEANNRGLLFKFNDKNEGVLKGGERSLLEALNNGVKITPIEFEAVKALDEQEDVTKNGFKNIITTIIRQANELAYAIEKEKYKKIKAAE